MRRREFLSTLGVGSSSLKLPAAGASRAEEVVPPGGLIRRETFSPATRRLKHVSLTTDFVVVGGGLAGTCAAITAARAGIRVVLIQDRPVLGGNASSEVRLWVLGATAHMGNNNRWAREGGVVDEILVENLHRNREGNPVIVDAILLEKVVEEPNITLLLNTAVHELEKQGPDRIRSVTAYCSQNETRYTVEAPLFCDASGDGVVGFLAGAAFRMGAEPKEEFDEGFAPGPEYGGLLGHSIYFYSRDAGRPVRFVAPSFALKDITKLPKWKQLNPTLSGCRLWWLEWGGRLDTVHDTETIKWELWKVVYGVWDYIKNSGKFPEAANLELEWVGMIPGKRESRRFEGDYMLSQRDVVEQRTHPDAVSYGGWSIDLHPADGVYSKFPSCTQWHSKGIYQIPYRCLYSRNIVNLFLAGRIISASHVAFGSTRVMGTCANSAQAVGMAAALCRKQNLLPRDLLREDRMRLLQRELMKAGQYIPGFRLEDPEDLCRRATVTASSRLRLDRLESCGKKRLLNGAWAMLLPVPADRAPVVSFYADVRTDTTLVAELRASSRWGNFTPDKKLATIEIPLRAGENRVVTCNFDVRFDRPQYVFYCLLENPNIALHLSDRRVTGILACRRTTTQSPPEGIGIDSFEMWRPQRRPDGENMALAIDPPLDLFGPSNVVNGVARPTTGPNAWVAAWDDPRPRLTFTWDQAQHISEVVLAFDTDFDHPMESVLMGHPESEMPFCVKRYRILDADGNVIHEVAWNHQTRNVVRLPRPISTKALHIEVLETHGAPAAIFEVRCYRAPSGD